MATFDPITGASAADILTALVPGALAPLDPGSPLPQIVIDPASLTIVGGTSSIGFYDGSYALDPSLGDTGLGAIGSGLILTSGTMPGLANTVGYYGTDNGLAGDVDLDAVVNKVFQTTSMDATSLSFSFDVTDPTVQSISFKLVFGSEEYPEWVNQFVDIAGVFVNGVNYAYFDSAHAAPLSVIGSNLASNYFVNNAGGALPIEYDGVSGLLTISAPVHFGTNTLKIAIADTRDHIYDSGIVISGLQASTLPVQGVTLDHYGTPESDNLYGNDASENIQTETGDDVIAAAGGDDVVQSGEGDDKVIGGSGNDYVDGNDGEDRVYYAGTSTDYDVTYDAVSGTWSVHDLRPNAPDGTDTLANVEHVVFADGSYDLSDPTIPLVLTPSDASWADEAWATALATPSGVGGSTGSGPAGNVAPVVGGGQVLEVSEFQSPIPSFGEVEAPEPTEVELEIEALNDDVTNATVIPNAINLQAGVSDANTADALTVTLVTPLQEGFSLVHKDASVTPTGYYGAMVTNPSVDYLVIDPESPAFDHIPDGVTQTFVFEYTVTDGKSDPVTTTATFVVTGTNDAPVVTGMATGSGTEDGTVFSIDALADGLVHDPDSGETAGLTIVAPPAGSLEVETPDPAAVTGHGVDDVSNGEIPDSFDLASLPAGVTFDGKTFTIDPTADVFQSLAEGELQTITIEYGITDGKATVEAKAQFTIVGSNDVPKVSGPVSITVDEDAFGAGGSSSQFSESEALELEHQGVPTAAMAGALNLLANASDVDHNAHLSAIVDDAALPNFIRHVHTESVHVIDPVTGLDVETQSADAFVLDLTAPGIQHVAAGATETVTVDYFVTDGVPGSTPVATQAIFTIIGENDAPIIATPALLAVDEDQVATIDAPLTVDALANAFDVDDGDQANLAVVGVPDVLPPGVSYDPDTHTFSFDPSDVAYQALAQGEIQTVVVSYGITDGTVTTPTIVEFVVTGVNDKPLVAGPATGTPNEDGNVVFVNALGMTTDIDDPQFQGHGLFVKDVPTSLPAGVQWDEASGRFSLDPTDAAYQSLAKGQSIDVVVDYVVSDGLEDVPTQVVFTVSGRNDAPTVPGFETQTVSDAAAPLSVDLLKGAFDIDAGESLSVMNGQGASLTITAAAGTWAAPIAFTVSGSTLSLDPKQFAALTDGQHLDLTVSYTVTDGNADGKVPVIAHIVIGGTDTGLTLVGVAKGEILGGSGAADTIDGAGGNDSISAGLGADEIVVRGSEATGDVTDAGGGTDTLKVLGSSGVTLTNFNSGPSAANPGSIDGIEIWSGNGRELLGTGKENSFDMSKLQAVNGLTYVDAGSGNDTVVGHDFGADLRGNSGNDKLFGGAGADVLSGGGGNDTMAGGAGHDIFVFDKGGNTDRITDFKSGEDTIQLTKALFGTVAAVESAIVYSDAAHTATITSKAGVIITVDGFDTAHHLASSDFLLV